ncbi:heavy-metal-associated domain-containing protein [Asticcacaulis sp. AND118]|uniref:heavy-metal-associated domain-containing protein n=1 Tax=Asticcacaulis sp. AND118 TaxID=2840468 RepID=UPI001CFF8274|nr:heavy-metal-associated domain-containing protein [Asticcacaulis sp. AND118]UDF04072.1 heavy-metal-associated domain-containing protein [Asticcacaulis sp. AND118]
MQFHIDDMTCGGCARSVSRAIVALDSEAQVSADTKARTIEVETTAKVEDIQAALASAGFPATVM